MEGLACILLVEDDQDEIERVERVLASNRITNNLEVVSDGAEAVDFVARRNTDSKRELGSDPCLVLLDADSQQVDGVEVLQHMRAEEGSRDIPVAVLVSSEEEQRRIEDSEPGRVGFIRKPFDYDGFLDAAKQLDVYWSILDEKPPYLFGPHSEV